MTRVFSLILVLLVPLLAARCGQGPGQDRDGSRGPYLSGGFGGH